ncbi:hypothetical protein FHW20_004693 [Ochrobactrum intermedium]|uniref:Uncharacterized protein n=2 Tax=Brucella/Ochrobactrum group TaxID=2826938 RepID=A0ABR6AW64_9HYPH|nr:hypothetical protein [Brucella intermedia]MBA8853708.1 hypothetical protein [Brucella intermedia]
MEIVTGTVDNVSEGYYHQTTKKGGNSPVSHHTVSFTIANKQAHFRTHNPPSINPGDEVTIAGKSLSSGLNVYAFNNKTNGTYGTYYFATFFWIAVVWLVFALFLLIVGPGFFVILLPVTLGAGFFAYSGYQAREALKLCRAEKE